MITTEEIKRRLWDGANELRGSMDASRYKDYMLWLMFYKFLSDKILETFRMTSGIEQSSENELVYEYIKAGVRRSSWKDDSGCSWILRITRILVSNLAKRYQKWGVLSSKCSR